MSNPYEPPPQLPPEPRRPGEGDATGGLIPYKNGPALAAYYISILTILCCVTPLPLGIIPVVLGVMGLRKRAREPEVKGSVHAWIGIVLGGASAFCSVIMIFVAIAAILNR
jgi:hypothetical protein